MSNYLRWSYVGLLAAGCALAVAARPAQAVELRSPAGQLAVRLEIRDTADARQCLFYSVAYQGQPILADCRLGLELKDAPALDRGFRLVGQQSRSHAGTWRPVYGERAEIRDHYNELRLDLADSQSPGRQLQLIVRAYDEGAAFCYAIPKQEALGQFTIVSESTEFRFTGDHRAHATYSAQGVYSAVPLSKIQSNCERPLTVEIAGGPCVAVAEARLVDYARMRLQPVQGQAYTLQPMLGSAVSAATPFTTPWRVLMVADTPAQLLERNDLILNLNDPCAIADTSWIKPGKVIREVTLTTEGGQACVDFAVARGLQYVEFDVGWYGPEGDAASDATRVKRDEQKAGGKGKLDLEAVIRYAAQRGIGILLYVNRRAAERQLDEILPLYERWGVKGIKLGFVQVGPQQWTAWLHEAVRKAAQHHLLVDVHDEYRPTGYSRTYPNLLTVEGVHGNECMPSAENNAVLPFTRFLCGPADCTVCWYCPRVKNSRAHQLATAVVYYSPFQFLYWYDRPAQYQGDPELEFFKQVPTVWDDTRVLAGQIGQYVVVARRSGESWFVASLNAVERRQLEIPLGFLAPNRPYVAEIYADRAPAGGDPTGVTNARRAVDSRTVLTADMAANGGHAVRIVPAAQ